MKVHGIGAQKILQQYDVKRTKDNPHNDLESISHAQSDVKSGSYADSINLSSGAGLLNKVKNVVNTAPDIRSEKVASLKREIEKGTYRIDSDKIADKMLREAVSELLW